MYECVNVWVWVFGTCNVEYIITDLLDKYIANTINQAIDVVRFLPRPIGIVKWNAECISHRLCNVTFDIIWPRSSEDVTFRSLWDTDRLEQHVQHTCKER